MSRRWVGPQSCSSSLHPLPSSRRHPSTKTTSRPSSTRLHRVSCVTNAGIPLTPSPRFVCRVRNTTRKRQMSSQPSGPAKTNSQIQSQYTAEYNEIRPFLLSSSRTVEERTLTRASDGLRARLRPAASLLQSRGRFSSVRLTGFRGKRRKMTRRQLPRDTNNNVKQ